MTEQAQPEPKILKPLSTELKLSWENIGKLTPEQYNALSREKQKEISAWIITNKGRRT